MSGIDASLCPLCGASNQCAQLQQYERGAMAPVSDCWCFSTPIAPAALAQIPEAMRGKACLCPACAASGNLSNGVQHCQPPEQS